MPLQQVDNVKLHLKEIYIIQSIMQGLGIPLASTAIPQCTYCTVVKKSSQGLRMLLAPPSSQMVASLQGHHIM